jgi:FkbM family methyltransferase
MSSKSDKWVKAHKFPTDCWACQKQLMPNARVVVDVGAHMGGRIIGRYLEMYPDAMIYAFEPSPKSYAGLLEQIPKYGGGGGARVRPFRAAVLDYDGKAEFNISSLSDRRGGRGFA